MNNQVEMMISEEEIVKRIIEIGKEIESIYKDRNITFICVLKGACFFATELAKRISNDIEMEFIQVSSYGGGTVSSGDISMKKDIETSIVGKDVIIIEDIIDSGNTLHFLQNYFMSKHPNSVKICALLDKPSRREVVVEVDYVGFSIPDEFVVGYGLDYNEQYRNLPYIGKVKTYSLK